MGLSWDSTACDLPETLSDNDAATRTALVFSTMVVGINEITEKNAREYFSRLSFWEKIAGAYRFGNGEPVYFTPEDVLKFVGLRTNASPMTTAQFRKNVFETHERFNVPRSI